MLVELLWVWLFWLPALWQPSCSGLALSGRKPGRIPHAKRCKVLTRLAVHTWNLLLVARKVEPADSPARFEACVEKACVKHPYSPLASIVRLDELPSLSTCWCRIEQHFGSSLSAPGMIPA